MFFYRRRLLVLAGLLVSSLTVSAGGKESLKTIRQMAPALRAVNGPPVASTLPAIMMPKTAAGSSGIKSPFRHMVLAAPAGILTRSLHLSSSLPFPETTEPVTDKIDYPALELALPLGDKEFIFRHCIDMPGFWKKENIDPEIIESAWDMISAADQFGRAELLPLSLNAERKGCQFSPHGEVILPPGYSRAYQLFCEQQFPALSMPKQYGGMGYPLSASLMITEVLGTYDWAWVMYHGLALGCARTLLRHASDEIKDCFLPKLTTGEWLGTMCLTEPQCGTDVGMVRTKAVQAEDGKYRISGEKIFISAGDHELHLPGKQNNICHLVLARAEGASDGTKGLSLFLVPKKKVDLATGNITGANDVSCTRLESKMGINASSTCALYFDNAEGLLVGELHQGFRAMLDYMNISRIGVGVQGAANLNMAAMLSAYYAKERTSERSATGKVYAPERASDPLLAHANIKNDVALSRGRSMVASYRVMQSFLQGEKMLAGDKTAERKLREWTPALKKGLSESAVDAALKTVGIWGRHGFITENHPAHLFTTSLIGTIYEGHNYIQGLDYMFRTVIKNKGLPVFMDSLRYMSQSAQHMLMGPHRRQSIGLMKYGTIMFCDIGWILRRGALNVHQVVMSAAPFIELVDALQDWSAALYIMGEARKQERKGDKAYDYAEVIKLMDIVIDDARSEAAKAHSRCHNKAGKVMKVSDSFLNGGADVD